MSCFLPEFRTDTETFGIRILLLASVFCLGAVSPVFAQSSYSFHPEPLQPRIEAGAKVGTERSMGTMEGWAPIAQDDDSVLYADIRWMADDEENQEGNLGLGYRSIVNDKLVGGDAIMGGHAWVDRRRTDRGSTFYQVTAGAEYLKEDWDVKANAYIPLNKEKEYLTANGGNANPYLSGTGIFVDTNGTLVEEAQPGGDIEVGYRIPAFEQNIDAIRVYGGGYAFIGDRSDDTVGGRIRTSVDINPLINVGARFQYDEPRGSQGFLEATLRFPIKAKKRFQTHGLRARLDESPERDIDIVTGSTVTDSGLRKEVLNTTSGQVQRVIHVDNTASSGGNGSKETPYNTLAAAQAAMLDNDVIYVHRGTGTSTGMDQGITINKNNVQLIGSGTDFVFDTDKFVTRRPGITPADGTVIIAGGLTPVITNGQTRVDDYTGNGVFVTGNDAIISGVTVQGATGHGIAVRSEASNSIDNITISDVTSNANTYYGLRIIADAAGSIENVNVQSNTFNGSTTRGGMIVSAENGGHLGNVVIDNNTTNNNFTNGIYNITNNSSDIDQISITNNNAETNGQIGIYITNLSNGTIDQVTIDNNVSNTNQRGIYLQADTGAQVISSSITNNETNNNSTIGIQVSALNTGSTINQSIVDRNIANTNGQVGLYFRTTGTSSVSTRVSNNTATGNGYSGADRYGVFVDNDSTGTFNVDLGGGSLGSTGGNRIYNNPNRDVFVDSRPGTAAATSGTTISAQGNWWGVNTGLNQGTRATFDNGSASPGSSIDASNHLTTDPGI